MSCHLRSKSPATIGSLIIVALCIILAIFKKFMNKEEFQKLFQQRVDCFVSSVVALCDGKATSWEIYDCEPELLEDGSVSMLAKTMLPQEVSDSMRDLIDYITFLMKQGFRLELIFDWSPSSINIAVTSWGNEDEPEWDDIVKSDFVLRWNGVNGPESLGMVV